MRGAIIPFRQGDGAPLHTHAAAVLDAALAQAVQRYRDAPCGAAAAPPPPDGYIWPRAEEEGLFALNPATVMLQRAADPLGLAQRAARRIAQSLDIEADALEEFLFDYLEMDGAVETSRLFERMEKLDCLPGLEQYPSFDKESLIKLWESCADISRAARDRGIPPIPIFAMSKSGSSFVTIVLSRLLETAAGVASVHHRVGMPPWICFLGRFPFTVHDHMYPTEGNVELLRAAGIKKVGLLVRDPRQSVISLLYHEVKYGALEAWLPLYQEGGTDAVLDHLLGEEFRGRGGWLRKWRLFAAPDIEIEVFRYEDMVRDKVAFFVAMLESFGAAGLACASMSRVKSVVEAADEAARRDPETYKYRNGTTDEWRDILSRRQRTLAQEAAGDRFAGLYEF